MKMMSRETLRKMIEEGEDFALVDVLGPEQYEEYHLPGAVNVPMDEEFEQNIQKAVPDKSKPVVVYCLNIACQASPAAAHVMTDHLDYENVRHYAEGKIAWKKAGLPVEAGSPGRSVAGEASQGSGGVDKGD